MVTPIRVLIGTLLLPLLAFTGVVLVIAAHSIGRITPLTILLTGIGLVLYLVVTLAGAILFGDGAAGEPV